MAEITQEDYNKIAQYLGNILDGRAGKQILIMSDVTILDKLELHPCNRNIDQSWVETLKIPMMKLVSDNESIGMLYAAIVKGDVERAKIGENGDFSFKCVLVDGQHRWNALKQIRDQIPEFNFDAYLTVYIVENDAELISRVKRLNTRREFDNNDKDLLVRAIFKESLDSILDKRTRHRFVNYLYNHRILRNTQWTKQLWNRDKSWFTARLIEISREYKELYLRRISENTKIKTSVLGQTIQETSLYQLIDETNNWLEKIPEK